MKKSIFIAILCFFAYAESNAQVTFKPGVRGGVNFAHLSKGDNFNATYYDPNTDTYVSKNSDNAFPSKTDFYLGFYGALRLTKYYTLQPEINYTRQGAKMRDNSGTLDVSYLSFAVMNKFSFNEKFNVHVGPTIDFIVEKNYNIDSDVDLAFILGAGYNFTKNFAIEARVKKGIIPVIDLSTNNHSNVVFSLGAAYTFDAK